MKILYVRPYKGELDFVKNAFSEHELIACDSVEDVEAEQLTNIEVLSVFVDYQVTKEVFDLLPSLKFIATRSAGYDHIDTAVALERNIVISRVPHYGTRTVAEYAIALMFALSRNAFRSYTDMQRDVSLTKFDSYEGFDLCGKTLGVVGTGAIGKSVCEIGLGLGMKIVAFDVSPQNEWAQDLGIHYMSLEEVASRANILTIHVPSIPATHHLINESILRTMKPGTYLINTARGEVVDTKALVKVLVEGHLAGAGLDVLEGEHELREEAELLANGKLDNTTWETLVANHSLIDMSNVIVTPHIAFNTKEAKQEITQITVTNIQSFIVGQPQNIVT